MKQQMLEEEVRNLKKTIEALTAERDQLYEGWHACRSLALETIARAEAAEAREKECYEGLNAWPRSLALATLARAEAAEARESRLRAACAPLGSAMYFMDDIASDEDVCIISAKTVKDIRDALKGEQK